MSLASAVFEVSNQLLFLVSTEMTGLPSPSPDGFVRRYSQTGRCAPHGCHPRSHLMTVHRLQSVQKTSLPKRATHPSVLRTCPGASSRCLTLQQLAVMKAWTLNSWGGACPVGKGFESHLVHAGGREVRATYLPMGGYLKRSEPRQVNDGARWDWQQPTLARLLGGTTMGG